MTATIDINLPDRYDMLARKAVNQLTEIIAPVDSALEHIDALYSDTGHCNYCSKGKSVTFDLKQASFTELS